MSLDKAIQAGKEKRQAYRGSKAVSKSCRDNTCQWCKGNVEHKHKRRVPQQDTEQ
jgi:hypothetical protein